MGRSSSNKGITNRNANVMYAPPNTQDNTQSIRRIPGVGYGEQQQLIEQQKAAPLPKDTSLQPQPSVRTQMPQVDVFAETQRKDEPVTAGLPFGPGINPQPDEQIYQAQNIKDFKYQSWVETGDDSLLEFL